MAVQRPTSQSDTTFNLKDLEGLNPGQHKEYYWVTVEPGRENQAMTPEDVVNNHGVPEHVVLTKIAEERSEEEAVKSLPFALLLVILYALMNLSHDSQGPIRSVEEAIEFDIKENANFAFSTGENGNEYMGHKTYQDVNSYGDFWSWMNKGISALYFQTDYPISEGSSLDMGPLTDTEKSFYLWHNKKIGPMRLRKEALPYADCLNEDMGNAFDLTCYEVGDLDLSLDPVDFDVAQLRFPEDRSETVWVEHGNHSLQLRELETNRWVNNQTYRVMVSFLAYNGPKDIFVQTNVHFLFARSGRIWKALTHRSFVLEPYSTWEAYLWDILFFSHITLIFVTEMAEVFKELWHAKGDCMAFLREYISFWNVIDWLSIIMAYTQLGVWFTRYGYVKTLETHVRDFPTELATCTEDACKHFLYDRLYDDVRIAGQWMREQNLLGAFYPVMIVLRLFKAFQSQPRLALVSKTLYNSSGDLAHFGIVFLSAFFSFVLVFMAIFGREMTDFAQFDRAVMTLVRAFLGDFDYDTMDQMNRASAFFFILIFEVTMFLIMLNMLVAIVMDVYADTKGHLTKGETLWDECYEIAERFYMNKMGKRMPFNELVTKYLKARGDGAWKSKKVISVQEFTELVPGLGEAQAKDILIGACQDWGEAHNVPVQMRDVLGVASMTAEFAGQVNAKFGGSASSPKALGNLHQAAAGSKPSTMLTAKEIAEMDGLSLEELFKAAQIRCQMEFGQPDADEERVNALSRILESCRNLSVIDESKAPKVPGGRCGVGVTV